MFTVKYPVLLALSISLVIATSINSSTKSSSFECNQNGYMEYLSQWTLEKKSSPRDPSTDEFKQRLGYFKENCLKIREWNKKDKYKLEFTYYADWSENEFEMLGSTTQRYTGMKPDIYETQPFFNNTNLQYLYPSIDPCNDMFEGNTLRDTISSPQNCSVSWAFAITNSIEYAVKKMYKEEYEQDINIALSAQELIDCAGNDHGIENGCDGIPVAWGFDYVFENGIAYRQYYPHTNVYGECKEIPNEHKYHIAGYEKPDVYNKYGLFELLKKGPVAVSLGLDPEYFQFYQNDRETGPYFNTGYYRPSVYGVLLEYNQYKENGKEDVIEWPYFSVETRLRACDSVVFRLPILESIDNANIGGIAGFAIRPIVSEIVPDEMKIITSFTCNENIYPTIESIPAYATELIFEENSYSDVLILDLSRFTQLQTLIVKDGAFHNCYYVHIDNPHLKVVIIGKDCFAGIAPTDQPISTSFSCNEKNYPSIDLIPIYATELIFEENSYPNIQTLDLSRFTQLQTLIVKNGALRNCYYVHIDNPDLATVLIGDNCFNGVASSEIVSASGARRLSNFPSAFVIDNASSLSIFTIGSGSLTNINKIEIGNEVGENIAVMVGNGSFSDIETIVVGESNESQEFGYNLSEAIKNANPDKQIDIILPTIVPPEPVDPIEVTLIRTTKESANNEESFKIYKGYDSYNELVFTQPEVENNTQYSWLLTLQNNTIYTLVLSDNSGNGWTPYSNLEIMIGNETIGTFYFTSGSSQTYYFTIGSAPLLIVSKESHCTKLNQPHWNHIIVMEGLCNSRTSDLVISDYESLSSLVVKKNSLTSVNALILRNLPHLKQLVFEIGSSYSSNAFANTKEIELSNIPYLNEFVLEDSMFYNVNKLNITSIACFTYQEKDLPSLSNITTGKYSCYKTTSFTLSNVSSLMSFTSGEYSFYKTTTIILNSII